MPHFLEVVRQHILWVVGNVIYCFVTNLTYFLMVKEFWKLVKIWRNCRHNKVACISPYFMRARFALRSRYCFLPVCVSVCLSVCLSVCSHKNCKTTEQQLMWLDTNMCYGESLKLLNFLMTFNFDLDGYFSIFNRRYFRNHWSERNRYNFVRIRVMVLCKSDYISVTFYVRLLTFRVEINCNVPGRV